MPTKCRITPSLVVEIADKVKLVQDKILELRGAAILDAPYDALIPKALLMLVPKQRKYIIYLVHQMNGAYHFGWYDAVGALMRRLVESLIIDALERQLGTKATTDDNGKRFPLSKLINRAQSELTLPSRVKRALNGIQKIGDNAVHGPRSNLTKKDIDEIKTDLRKLFQELAHIAYS